MSRIFHQLIDPMRYLHTKFVRQPTPADISPAIELDPKFMQFNGAVGAIDGTHIPAFVPIHRQTRFWSRKNNISQNILAAVSFKGLFVYVLAGAEGSVNDSSLIRIARTMSLHVPRGRFYLADAGFRSRQGILIPFPRVRYHLQDWGEASERPSNSMELYNLRHAQLRSVIEHVFRRYKRKFKIIRHSAPEYAYTDQIKIIYAVTGLFNFIMLGGKEPLGIGQDDTLTPEKQYALAAARHRADAVIPEFNGVDMRQLIANWLWLKYQAYLAGGGGEIVIGDEIG